MILSDREINLALRRDQIRITPAPLDKAISSTSIDLTLDEEISFWTTEQEPKTPAVIVYPGRPEFDVPRSRHAGKRLRRHICHADTGARGSHALT